MDDQELHPIPTPDVLDADRVLHDNRERFTDDGLPEAEVLNRALHESCAYAQQLWDNLDAVRRYLMSLLPAPRVDEQPSPAASPVGADGEQAWQGWQDAFAAVTSVLCGPHGDSGFGRQEARRAYDRHHHAATSDTGFDADPA